MSHTSQGVCALMANRQAVVFHRNDAVKSLFISSAPLSTTALYPRELESITALFITVHAL